MYYRYFVRVSDEKTKTPATANIRFSKKIGFKVFSNLKINLPKKKKQEVD